MEEQRGSARLGTYLKRLRTGYGFSLRRVEKGPAGESLVVQDVVLGPRS